MFTQEYNFKWMQIYLCVGNDGLFFNRNSIGHTSIYDARDQERCWKIAIDDWYNTCCEGTISMPLKHEKYFHRSMYSVVSDALASHNIEFDFALLYTRIIIRSNGHSNQLGYVIPVIVFDWVTAAVNEVRLNFRQGQVKAESSTRIIFIKHHKYDWADVGNMRRWYHTYNNSIRWQNLQSILSL